MRTIMDDIVSEINKRGYSRFFPLEVYVYYKYEKNERFNGQCLFVHCPTPVGRLVTPIEKEHSAFVYALWGNRPNFASLFNVPWISDEKVECCIYPGYYTIVVGPQRLFLKQFEIGELEQIQKDAWKYGLRVQHRIFTTAMGGCFPVNVDILNVSQR